MDVQSVVSNDDLDVAFTGTTFEGKERRRKALRNGLLKRATGHYTAHTIRKVMIELKLITPSSHNLTTKGKNYLYLAFEDGTSV